MREAWLFSYFTVSWIYPTGMKVAENLFDLKTKKRQQERPQEINQDHLRLSAFLGTFHLLDLHLRKHFSKNSAMHFGQSRAIDLGQE